MQLHHKRGGVNNFVEIMTDNTDLTCHAS